MSHAFWVATVFLLLAVVTTAIFIRPKGRAATQVRESMLGADADHAETVVTGH